MKRISNREVPDYVSKLEPFKANNIYANYSRPYNGAEAYIVFSYGPHFPLAVYVNGRWIVNTDKYSQTTSRHQSLVRRALWGEPIYSDTKTINNLIGRPSQIDISEIRDPVEMIRLAAAASPSVQG